MCDVSKYADVERRYIESFEHLNLVKEMCDLVVLYDNTEAFNRFAIYKNGNFGICGNVTNKANLFSHQYMSNVEAPKAEAQKLYTAYKGMETEQVTFSIPVYENMPEEVSAIPSEVKNPNNWLKTLSVYNLGTQKEIVMTPVFNATDAVGTVYSVNVANNVTSINVKATTASTSASVTGNRNYELKEGTNLITVSVTSESGDTRDYVLKIVRAEAEKK